MRKIIYIYDALCPWCYAFTPVVQRLLEAYGNELEFEALSGGMIVGDLVREASHQGESQVRERGCREIEERTGVPFGDGFFSRIRSGGYRLDSMPPAIALAVFREMGSPRSPIEFIQTLLRSIFLEGGDPNEESFYEGVAEEVELDPNRFLENMGKEEFRDKALYDFALAKQLRVDAFPRLFLQTADDYFHLVSKGYSEFEAVKRVVDAILSGSDGGAGSARGSER